VKICGLTTPADARAVTEAGADAAGFVFWPRSPRVVTPERAREVAVALPPFVTRVGVFVDEDPVRIGEIAEAVGLDAVQLHGDEDPALLAGAGIASRRVIKALRMGPGVSEAIARWAERGAGVLLDAGTRTLPGGTGRRLDWPAVAALREKTPWMMLAGGLDPGNVAEAVRIVGPDAVAVSSGVESAPGVKDPARVAAFVAAARAAVEVRA
jgi:phosphoribosylanthranilate isomerase